MEDIQSGVLSPRPSPYVATYILFRIDDRKVGREMMQKLSTVVASVRDETSPAGDAWVSVSLTFQGLKALGVPQESLDSFPPEFRVGMAARAHELGDTGESSPEKWEKPLGTKDVHVVLTALSPNEQKLESVLERAKKTYQELQGIKADLASELLRIGYWEGAFWFQRRDQSSGSRREWNSRHQPKRATSQSRRVRIRLPR